MRREHDDKDINIKMRDRNRRNSFRGNAPDNNETSELKEWNLSDDEEIQEFLSRDFDVVSESRRRLQERQRSAKNGRIQDTDGALGENYESIHEKSDLYDLYDKNLDTQRTRTMQLLFSALAVLVVILIVAIAVTNSDDDEAETTQQVETTVNEETISDEETKEATIEPEAEGADIHSLIVGYIDAAYIQADMEAVALFVDDTTNINVEKYKSRKKYIESYENIKCYKFDSAIENAYIIFVTYDTKLYNIETLAPSAETFIVKLSGTDNKFIIHNLTVEEELDSYIAGASKFAYTSEIRADIEKRLKEALATDAELKRVYDLMITTGSKATEAITGSTTAGEMVTDQNTTAAQ